MKKVGVRYMYAGMIIGLLFIALITAMKLIQFEHLTHSEFTNHFLSHYWYIAIMAIIIPGVLYWYGLRCVQYQKIQDYYDKQYNNNHMNECPICGRDYDMIFDACNECGFNPYSD